MAGRGGAGEKENMGRSEVCLFLRIETYLTLRMNYLVNARVNHEVTDGCLLMTIGIDNVHLC